MGKMTVEKAASTNLLESKVKEFKRSVVIYSMANVFKTENFYFGRSGVGCSSYNPDEFKIAASQRYPLFKKELMAAIREIAVESGVHYYFEDKFNEYFMENQHMAAYLLQRNQRMRRSTMPSHFLILINFVIKVALQETICK